MDNISIAPYDDFARDVRILNYNLGVNYVHIYYSIITKFNRHSIEVEGIPLFVSNEDFAKYKHLSVNELLKQVLIDYL